MDDAVASGSPGSPSPPPVGIGAIFLAFTRIGLTSFGGGLGGWMLRDIVERRRWMGEAEFLEGLALAQAFPGMNAVNLALWIGHRLAGGRGAAAAALGITGPAFLAVLGIAVGFGHLAGSAATRAVLAGVAAAAIGLSLHMGGVAARRAVTGLVPAALTLGVFVAVFALRLPLLAVVAVAAPIGIYDAARRLDREAPP